MNNCTLAPAGVHQGHLVLVNQAHPIRQVVPEQELVAVNNSYPATMSTGW